MSSVGNNPFAVGDGRIARVQATTSCSRDAERDSELLRAMPFNPCAGECDRCSPLRVTYQAATAYLARAELSSVITWDFSACGPYEDLELSQIGALLYARLDEVRGTLALRYKRADFLARVELSAEDGRPHVHGLHRGSHVRADRFYEACLEAGLGLGKIQAIKYGVSIAGYVFKAALWSLLLEPPDARAVLAFDSELNRSRYYATPGFEMESNVPPRHLDAAVLKIVDWVEETNRRKPFWRMMPPGLLELVPPDRRGEE